MMKAAAGGGGIMRRILVLGVLGALAACGGSGGSGNGGTGGDGSAIVSHADQVRALDARAARLADLDLTASLPPSGTARYAGQMGATAVFGSVPVTVTADVDLTVRFGAGTVSGSFARASAADGTVSGSGLFGEGTAGSTGIDAPVTGTLTRLGVAHAVDGTLRGAFLGAGAEAIAGAVEGRLLRDGAEAGHFDGEVWAER
jgi:hypothetical protein